MDDLEQRPLSKIIEGLDAKIAQMKSGGNFFGLTGQNASTLESFKRERARWVAERDANGRGWLDHYARLERSHRARGDLGGVRRARMQRGQILGAYPHLGKPAPAPLVDATAVGIERRKTA